MWIRRPGGGGYRRPPLKKEIEEAQRNSLSAAGAARYLGVSYATYKKYARSYGIHEQHVNQGGKGIPKPHAKGKRFALSDILEGKHPTYNVKRLQQQLIKGGYMDEQCTLCPHPTELHIDIWRRYGLRWDEDTNELIVPQRYQAGDSIAESEMPLELRLVEGHLNTCRVTVDRYCQEVEMLMELNPDKKTGFDLRKWARGKARNVLSHALETRGTWTMNYRAWRWFVEARSSRHAEPEIRALAEKVLSVLTPLAPTYFSDFELTGIYDGIPEYVPAHHKI